jgi:pilus assembly protein CpaD
MTTTSLKLVAVAAVVAALSACASGKPAPVAPLASANPAAKTPIDTYTPRAALLSQDVAFAIHPEGLSPNQQSTLADLVARWKAADGEELTLRVPSDGSDPGMARRSADAINAFLEQLGVPRGMIRMTGYVTAGAPSAPVIVAFKALAPVVADCSTAWDSLTATKSNAPYRTFGCAEEANIAQMVADPHDLVAPAREGPADNVRMQVVLTKYRQGQTTSSATDSQASGKVSGQ